MLQIFGNKRNKVNTPLSNSAQELNRCKSFNFNDSPSKSYHDLEFYVPKNIAFRVCGRNVPSKLLHFTMIALIINTFLYLVSHGKHMGFCPVRKSLGF